MSCPTCSHTVHRLGCQFSGDPAVCKGTFWCPRCGTITTDGSVSIPALVDRCRAFEHDPAPHRWRGLGIKESIRPEGER